jgi:hypothetical protein
MRAVLLALLALCGTANAQTHEPPRTAEGRPDFQGVWTAVFITRIQRPKDVAATIVAPENEASVVKAIKGKPSKVNDPDFEYYDVSNLAKVKGTLRASQLVEPTDGQIPFSKQALAQVERSDAMFELYDNPEERDTSERCLSGIVQAPIRPLPMLLPFQFVQTPDAVVMTGEDVEALRIVHIGGELPPSAVRSREGWSSGHWDEDTLVVETTHLSADDPYRVNFGPSLIVGLDSRIIERLSFVSADELLYQFTIEDPALYTRPWRAEFSMTRAAGTEAVYEYACHGANYTLANVLKAGRANDGKKPKK